MRPALHHQKPPAIEEKSTQKKASELTHDGNSLEQPLSTLKYELRPLTAIRPSNLSRYAGIGLHKSTGRWQASYKNKYLGLFSTEVGAAEARWRYIQEHGDGKGVKAEASSSSAPTDT